MKRDEAPENIQRQVTEGTTWLVKEFELYSVNNRRPFKYGGVTKSMFQEYYLQDVVEFRWSAV